MNTPAHALVNQWALGRKYPFWPIFLGAILPDIPIYFFYLWEKVVIGIAESRIWSVDYFQSAWQPIIDLLHSFPLILALMGLAHYWKSSRLEAFSGSLLLHSLLDFPLHYDDAHRHFFPLSNWRFNSPISYWDSRRYGVLGAGIELLLVLAASWVLFRRYPYWLPRIALVSICLLNMAAYWMLYVHA